MNPVMLTVFFALFALVTVIGFFASRWKKADLNSLNEWGLAGRQFGTVITWFLLGGDLYTAYTFIAMPALIFGVGAYGFFAIPYVILIFPFAFVVFPRLWAVASRHGCITPADFIRVRYGSRWLATAIAVTGIVATMPYIALNLVGIEVVVGALGFPTEGIVGEIPLIVAFAILAAYTYTSGLRAPAMIAVVKDVLIYITVIAAIIVIPRQLGGFEKIFAAVPPEKLLLTPPEGKDFGQFSNYITVVIGSALALFMYPHAITAMFSAASGNAIRRNMVWMPLYTLTLGLLALMGFFALAAGVKDMPEYAPLFARYGSNFAIPALFLHSFPAWFAGIAFATIAIGALVPAAIMSIASANLYTRNIHREFFNPNVTPAQETQLAKIVSLVVKFGALFFVLFMPQQYAIQLQLLGGIWMIQTLPAIVGGAFTRWFDHRALLLGWAIGIGTGTWMAWLQNFTKSTYNLELLGYAIPGYAAVYALALNLIISIVGTLLVRAVGLPQSADATQPTDFDDIEAANAGDTRPVPGSIPAIE
ncbi:MAG: sodium:solute symporter family protein [Spongiibacteraceae bacterium]